MATLEQKIQQGIARRQFTLSPKEDPECRLSCNWCGESILVDFFQFGMSEMTRRMNDFLALHTRCEPAWKTKTPDMMLTPKEKIS